MMRSESLRTKTRANLVLFGLAALIIALDQASKVWIRQTLLPYQSTMPIRWLEPYVVFTHVENPGAAFGMGQGLGTVFVFAAFFAVALIVLYFRRFVHESRLLGIALGLQLGGAVGNLIDRLTIGAVTDFINLGWFPVFNVADSAITVGSILLAYYALFLDRPPTENEGIEETESTKEGSCKGDVIEQDNAQEPERSTVREQDE
jgi:signal peptidase II